MSAKEITLFVELCIQWLERNGINAESIPNAIDATVNRVSIEPDAADRQEITRQLVARVL